MRILLGDEIKRWGAIIVDMKGKIFIKSNFHPFGHEASTN